MSCGNVLEHLVKEGTVSSVLKRSNTKKEEVQEFQNIMHQMGFDAELKWSSYGADGYYGNACADAVKAFAAKNGLTSNGEQVDDAVANAIIKRYDSLDEMEELYNDLKAGQIEQKYYRGSSSKHAVAALQTLLNDLGYGQQLNWAKYKNDGDYGTGTANAVGAFLVTEDLEGSTDKLSTAAAQKILDLLSPHYGADWAKNAKNEIAFGGTTAAASSGGTASTSSGSGNGALTAWTGSNFQGKKVITDVNFVDSLNKINGYAQQNNVKIYVTSSFRTSSNVAGAIVTPAKKSNHMVGHAIDMNIVYNGGWANSAYLKKSNESNWNPSVKGFIDAIRQDPGLRWGGDFNAEDPVHIDDGLNLKNPTEWEARYQATQAAWQAGSVS